MAATTQINTRILNKIDSWSAWQAVANTFTPKRGEICIVEIPSSTSNSGLTPPATGIKVGDGTTKFGALPWIQAIAGDVTAWCKTNMADFDKFKAQVAAAVGVNVNDLNGAISALQSSVGALEANYNTLNSTVAGHTSSIETINAALGLGGADTSLGDRVEEIEGTIAGYTSTNTIASKISAVENRITAIDGTTGTVAGLTSKVNTLVGTDTSKSVRTIAAEETAKIVNGAPESYDTLKEIADWITNDTTGAAEMANDIADIQTTLGITDGAALPATVDTRITNAKNAVIGASNDASSASTIYGAKKYAEEKAAAAVNALDKTIADTNAGVITAITQTDGVVSATQRKVKMADLSDTDTFIFYCGSSTVLV